MIVKVSKNKFNIHYWGSPWAEEVELSNTRTARVEIQLKRLQLKVFSICVLILIWSTSGEFGILPLDVLRGGKETHLFKEG